jgi:hypothetical protein
MIVLLERRVRNDKAIASHFVDHDVMLAFPRDKLVTGLNEIERPQEIRIGGRL